MSPPMLEPIAFAGLPGWIADDHLAAFAAFCESAGSIDGSPRLADVAHRALAQATQITTAHAARRFFEENFRPQRIVYPLPAGLVTGYYEPVIEGSTLPTRTFSVPVYRRPTDLENCVADHERGAKSDQLTHMRRTSAGLEPFAKRADIEQGALAGQGLELAYLADPVDAFFLHVQGSGVIRLPDGAQLRITYNGKNGHPYTSLGRTLIDDGTFSPDQMTLQALTGWLQADPERGRRVMWRNASFVFFKPLDGDRAEGVLGRPLHSGRSLAVDTTFHPLGSLIYVSSPSMSHVGPVGLQRLMVAHDVGSAITGPERGDIFFGSGPAALALAGITKHAASFTVLTPVVAS